MGYPLKALRDPFDDALFSSLAARHGITEGHMPAQVRQDGWTSQSQRTRLPDGFPEFAFLPRGKGIGASLAIQISKGIEATSSTVGCPWAHISTSPPA